MYGLEFSDNQLRTVPLFENLIRNEILQVLFGVISEYLLFCGPRIQDTVRANDCFDDS